MAGGPGGINEESCGLTVDLLVVILPFLAIGRDLSPLAVSPPRAHPARIAPSLLIARAQMKSTPAGRFGGAAYILFVNAHIYYKLLSLVMIIL